MASVEPTGPVATIDPATEVGLVALTVADLTRSVGFYTRALGMSEVGRAGPEAVLGLAGGRPLLRLIEQPGALPWMVDAMTGLYHLALLLPDRADLGAWLRHYVSLDYPPPGQGDHVVSEALYLRDPDGHGIEIYADRPREGWRWADGQVQMGAGPVDVRGLLAAAAGRAWSGLPSGATVGHVHLQVGDVAAAERFYCGALGFEVVARVPGALFVAAGGYHHHIGLNTWHSQGAGPAPSDTAALRFLTFALPDGASVAGLVARLDAAGVPHRRRGDAVALEDPWGHPVVLHAGPIGDAAAALSLAP